MGYEMVTTVNENIMRVINSDGVIVNEFDGNTNYVRSKKQDEFFKKVAAAKAEFDDFNNDAGKFIWSYPEKIQELIQSDEFSKADLTMVFYLATYVNGFGYLTHDNNSAKLNKSGLQKVLGVSRNLFNRFYNKLVQHEILLTSDKNFTWNESYNFYGATTGKAKPTLLIRTYVNQVRELYEAKNDAGKRRYSATSLYPIFALVPYLHRTTNIICKNPDVKNIDKIEYFTLREIAGLLDLKDSKKMSTSLSSILLDGQTTFRKVESKNEMYLQMNPRIFWRDAVVPDMRLVSEFDMIDNNRKLRKNKNV